MEHEENVRAGGVTPWVYCRFSYSKIGNHENIAEMLAGSEKIKDKFNSQSVRLLVLKYSASGQNRTDAAFTRHLVLNLHFRSAFPCEPPSSAGWSGDFGED
jgi:hypothetical protein